MDRRAKWSEGVDGRQETMGGVEVFSGVINRSRMLPLVWVGKVTCCVRLKSDRVDRNWAV